MTDNHDHFLTRVYDKQEGKMFYPGDKVNPNHYGNSPYELVAIDSCGLITLDPWKHEINLIPFGNRFVPMLCAAYKDKNQKLIYEHDIIKTPNMEYVVERYQGMFIAEYTDDYYSLDDVITQLKRANVQIEISGNIHENLNPLTKKEANHGK